MATLKEQCTMAKDKKQDDDKGSSIMDAIEGSQEAPNLSEVLLAEEPTEGDSPTVSMWGDFKVEIGVHKAPTHGGSQKYDWDKFPAPSNPDDSSTWPSVFVPNVGSKTLSASASAYRDKLQKAGKKDDEVPVFRFSVSKDPNNKGVRIFRAK